MSYYKLYQTVSDPRANICVPRDPTLGRRDSGTICFVSKFGGVAVKKNVSVGVTTDPVFIENQVHGLLTS